MSGDDRFCRGCGKPLTASEGSTTAQPTVAPAGDAPEGQPHSNKRRWVAAGVIAVLALAVAGVAIFALGGSSESGAQKEAHTEAAAFAALRTRLYVPFQTAMGQRTAFFTAERAFLGATRDANAKLKKFKGEVHGVEQEDKQISNANSGLEAACREPLSTVSCPNPTYPAYPSAPSVSGDVSGLHTAVAELSSLNAQVLAVTPQPELKVFYAQLQAAITSLSSDSQYNATALSEGVTEPSNGGQGSVEEKKVSTIHGETGLPSVRLMNRQAVQLLRRLRLEISQYDVPGGTDVDRSDHSVAE